VQHRHRAITWECAWISGINLALLDAPDAVMRLAPFAVSTHVKDIAVGPDRWAFRMARYDRDGGGGCARDCAGRAAREAGYAFYAGDITRDPLLIPCTTMRIGRLSRQGRSVSWPPRSFAGERTGKTWMERGGEPGSAYYQQKNC